MLRPAILFAVLACPSALYAQEKDVYGTLQSLDAANGTLTVLISQPKPTTRSFNLLSEEVPVVHASGKGLKLGDLRKYHRLALKLNGQDDVVSIRQDSDLEWATIVSIDRDKGLLGIRIGHAHRELTLTPAIKIFHDETPATLKSLALNTQIKLLLTSDARREVLEIRAGKGIFYSNPYCRWEHHSAMLIHKDRDKRMMRFVTLGERYETFDLSYDAWTALRIVHSTYFIRSDPIEKLEPFCKVGFYFATDTNWLSIVSAEIPFVSRVYVTKLDVAQRKLTAQLDADGKPEELTMAADIYVIRSGMKVELTEVTERQLATIGFGLDQKEVIFLQLLDK